MRKVCVSTMVVLTLRSRKTKSESMPLITASKSSSASLYPSHSTVVETCFCISPGWKVTGVGGTGV